MAKVDTTSPKLTRWDKQQRNIMERFTALKDGLTHGFDSYTLIHKQTLDSFSENYETVSESQEFERHELYKIIETSEDETRRKEAFDRLEKLDHIKDKDINALNDRTQSEGDKSGKKIDGAILGLLAASGLILGNKQVRQFLSTTGKSLLQIK